MNEYRYGAPENEKPLDRLVSDGGYTSIFRTIACVGDSLSSGEFETFDPETGVRHYYDLFEYSWGQFIARMAGSTVYNFSRGGMTASEYCDTYAEAMGWWNPDLKAQAYIIALGVNDLIGARQPIGEMSDIDPEDCEQNARTFTGLYARVIQRYKKIAPSAKFFLVTAPHSEAYDGSTASGADGDERVAISDAHAARLHELAAYFDNTYVIDLRAYAPVHDAAYIDRFYLHGHLNPMGYRITAEQIASYIDYIIRHNPSDFRCVGFINSNIDPLC